MLDTDLDLSTDLDGLRYEDDQADDDQDVNSSTDEESEGSNVNTKDLLEDEDGKKKKESDDDVSKPSVQAKKQEDAWVKNILRGAKDIDDCPTWLKERVSERLGIDKDVDDIEERVTKKVLENQKFEELKAKLPKLSKAQAEQLKQLYSDYSELGKFRALQTAVKIMRLDSEDHVYKEARGAMSVPPSGQSSHREKHQTGRREVDCHDEASTQNYEMWKKNGFEVDSYNNPVY